LVGSSSTTDAVKSWLAEQFPELEEGRKSDIKKLQEDMKNIKNVVFKPIK